MLYNTARWFLEHMDPVRANRVMIDNLEWFTTLEFHRKISRVPDEDPVTVMGLRFPNSVGLAAGLDRNGAQVSSFGAFGFGFVEVGTITPEAQGFKTRHPVVRRNADMSIAHAIEFENHGYKSALKTLKSADAFFLRGGITGVSIGASENSSPASVATDLVGLLAAFYQRADYLSLNLFCSRLEHPGDILRNAKLLSSILRQVADERERLVCLPEQAHLPRRPLVVKLPAFLADDDLKRAADVCAETGIDGITTGGPLLADAKGMLIRSWESVQQKLPQHVQFLSGAPVRERSSDAVCILSKHLAGTLPVIATGGILSTDDVKEKIACGAALVEILTGFLSHGPAFVADCVDAAAAQRAIFRSGDS